MLRKKTSFFKALFKKGNKNGSVMPSSIFLCKKMISAIDFNKARCIVELGPGDGVITREILKKMGPNTQLFLFEMNEEFVRDFLQFNDPRVHVIADSAEFMGKYLQEAGITHVDYIISSLPLTIFPPELKEKILDESRRLMSHNGVYMQYLYSTIVAKLLKMKFKRVKMSYVPLNIPPAFVFTCQV